MRHCIILPFILFSCSLQPVSNIQKRDAASFNNFSVSRTERGLPITQLEKQKATDELIDILKKRSYFDFVDSRAHGIPQNNAENKYWFGHWWTGVTVEKLNGKIIFHHPITGSDNTGIQTAAYLEGACFAFLLTKDTKYQKLTRKMIRGMSAWILSSSLSKNDPPAILSRSFYPASIEVNEEGRKFLIDYDKNRPGHYNEVSEYVRNPNNPYFGDIYLKNNRSTDDIGHMIRAIANVRSCRSEFDSETRADFDQMVTLYKAWAESVERNNFVIPTHKNNLKPIIIKNGLGDYNAYNYGIFDPACIQKLAVRLLHAQDAGHLECGSGISFLEKTLAGSLNNDPIEILRSHHTAAVALAKLNGEDKLAREIMIGMQNRMDRDMRVIKDPSLSPKFDLQDISSFFIHANNVGVPMTSEEARHLYEKIHFAKAALLNPANDQVFHVFDSQVPDGVYSYDPPHAGFYFYAFGAMLGSCTSMYRDKTAFQFLDCERLQKALLK